tara:strand:- start:5591 stop:6514 length:924 start_codon:yes stop_codon:yes gene_type:complete
MAKIFWIAEKSGDYMEIFGFNNKRKAEEKAMELSSNFSFGDTEVAKDGNEDGDNWFYSGIINAKECFLLYRKNGMPAAAGFDSEDEAREEYPGDGGGACFPVKLKGGMGEVYLSSEVGANGTQLWTFEDGDIYEEAKTTMRHIPTFESFINEKFRALEDKRFPVMTSFEVGFRDGKGKKSVLAYLDNSDESVFLNKKTIKDYEAAVKMTEAFVKKTKIKEKPIYDEPTMDSPGTILLILGQDDLPDRQAGKNLQPLYTQLSKLDTSESYTYKSEISQEIKDKDNDAYWDMAPDADKKELAKFYPNKK